MSIDEAHSAIAAALEKFPALTACGLLPTVPCGAVEPDEVAAALEFLRSCTRSRKADRSSYGLKHEAEICAETGYVSNGALVAAAVFLGFEVKPLPGEPNALVNCKVPADVKKQIARCREERGQRYR